jgi:hypothetical protein
MAILIVAAFPSRLSRYNLDHIAARADTVDAAVEELLALVPKAGL